MTSPILAAVVGSPISHSLSPLIHTVWAARAGIDGYYLPVEAAPDYDAFAKTMDSLQTIGFAGVNVTIPHKENALRYAAVIRDAAAAAGAANMLTFGDNGPEADNSDIHGFAAALRGVLKPDEKPCKAVMLGAGGAARGVLIALEDAGCKEIIITNRTRDKAEILADQYKNACVADWEDRNKALEGANVIVNTTALGMTGQPALDLDISTAPANGVVADIVYSPLQTPLLKNATRQNMRTVDGLSMLMHQAAPGFRAWFGAEAIIDADLRETLVNELRRRSSK